MKVSRVADAMAIPFWILLINYLVHIQDKTITEKILLLFGTVGFIMDTLFVFY